MNNIIDVHVHYGEPGDKTCMPTNAYWSKEFEETIAFLAMRLVTGSPFGPVTNERVKKQLFKVIKKSEKVKQFVVLALDKVYTTEGHSDDSKTHLFIPNSRVVGLREELKQDGCASILLGCSVHPYRKDWESELDWCIANGAVLCKWLCSTQIIDPSDSKCNLFYKKLTDSSLPLLFHSGPELSIPTSDPAANRYNNPKYIERALDFGVKVIVAHCALPFEPTDIMSDSSFFELVSLFQRAVEQNWKLYADLSALNILRGNYTKAVQKYLPIDKMLFASDYPIPMFNFGYSKFTSLRNWISQFWRILTTSNPFDRNYELLKSKGFDPNTLCAATGILKMP